LSDARDTQNPPGSSDNDNDDNDSRPSSSGTGSGNGSTSPSNSSNANDYGGYFGEFASAPSIDVGPSPADGDQDQDDGSSTETANDYSRDPGLTAAQSQSLASSAAVMDGYAFSPADVPPAANEQPEEESFLERAGDAVVGTGQLVGGAVVGAAETVTNTAIEAVSMVNDIAGAGLDAAVGWTGFDAFEGHAQRNAARGQAMFDAVASPIDTAKAVAGSVEEGWETFEGNWESGNYYDAGRQIGGVGVEVAAVAVPASKAGSLGRVGSMDNAAAVSRYNDLDAQGHAVSRHGAHVTDQMLEDRTVRGVDPITGTEFDGLKSTPGNLVTHNAPRNATSFNSVDGLVDAEQQIRGSEQYRDLRDAALASDRTSFRVEVPIDEALGPNYADRVSGQTRVGSVNNPRGAVPTDLTDGRVRAVFEFNSGSEPNLVTMHPVTK